MSKRNKKKPYWEMTTEELAAATAEFDQEFIADTFSPLTPEMKARWQAAKRKPGRSRNGNGQEVISISVSKDLLRRSDTLAKKMGLSRSLLVERGLKAVLAAEGQL